MKSLCYGSGVRFRGSVVLLFSSLCCRHLSRYISRNPPGCATSSTPPSLTQIPVEDSPPDVSLHRFFQPLTFPPYLIPFARLSPWTRHGTVFFFSSCYPISAGLAEISTSAAPPSPPCLAASRAFHLLSRSTPPTDRSLVWRAF